MNTYEVKGGISVFATGGHQKKGPFGKTGFSKIEKNTIFQISIRSPNRDFEKTPFFSSNLPNGPSILDEIRICSHFKLRIRDSEFRHTSALGDFE